MRREAVECNLQHNGIGEYTRSFKDPDVKQKESANVETGGNAPENWHSVFHSCAQQTNSSSLIETIRTTA